MGYSGRRLDPSLRAGRSVTAQTTRPAPIPGLGFETDKFSRAAIDYHFNAYFAKLLEKIGARRHATTGLTTLHYDSWEMNSQNWTAEFPAEFKAQARIRPDSVSTLACWICGGRSCHNERFLWDLRQTAQELVIENQAGRLLELGRKHGLQLSWSLMI